MALAILEKKLKTKSKKNKKAEFICTRIRGSFLPMLIVKENKKELILDISSFNYQFHLFCKLLFY